MYVCMIFLERYDLEPFHFHGYEDESLKLET